MADFKDDSYLKEIGGIAYVKVIDASNGSGKYADDSMLTDIDGITYVKVTGSVGTAGGILYKGTFGSIASTTGGDLPNSAQQNGDLYICDTDSYASTEAGETFDEGDWAVWNEDESLWNKLNSTDSVNTVFGRTGNVVAVANDYNALKIEFDPAGLDIVTSTEVQGSIEELDAQVKTNKDDINNGTVQGTGGNTYNIRASKEGAIAGDTRGENSVDLQTIRSNANMVASQDYSVLCGGIDNRQDGRNSVLCGGMGNYIKNQFAFIGSGIDNVIEGIVSAIAGGSNNTTFGEISFIGAGSNLITESYLEAIITGDDTNSYTPISDSLWFEADRLFVVGGKRDDNNNVLTLLKNGNLYIKGTLFENEASLSDVRFKKNLNKLGEVFGLGYYEYELSNEGVDEFNETNENKDLLNRNKQRVVDYKLAKQQYKTANKNTRGSKPIKPKREEIELMPEGGLNFMKHFDESSLNKVYKGFIAQELLENNETKDFVHNDDFGAYRIDYTKLNSWLNFKNSQRMDVLEGRLNNLENK